MARSSSPSLEAVLGDVTHTQDSDLDLALSDMGDTPPPPPSRGPGTALGTELEDLLGDMPLDSPEEKAKPPVPAPKPRPKAQTNSDIIMQDIYRMLAEIEIEIEKNLTPKNKLAKSDTFGLTNILQDLPPATKSPVRNANAEPKPQINTKPKPLLPAH